MSEAAPVRSPRAKSPRTARRSAAAKGTRPPAVEREESDGRQRLVREALALFAEKGFDGVTVRDIAAKSGVSVGLINHHFGSKEGLREEVDRYFLAQFEEVLALSPTASVVTPEDYAGWVDDWIVRHSQEWDVTVSYFRRALLHDSEWSGRLFRRFYAIVQDSVSKMDARGEVRPDVDRLWLPFLIIFLELGTTLLDPHIKRVLGRSGFDGELWRRRHRAYLDLIHRGVAPVRAVAGEKTPGKQA